MSSMRPSIRTGRFWTGRASGTSVLLDAWENGIPPRTGIPPLGHRRLLSTRSTKKPKKESRRRCIPRGGETKKKKRDDKTR